MAPTRAPGARPRPEKAPHRLQDQATEGARHGPTGVLGVIGRGVFTPPRPARLNRATRTADPRDMSRYDLVCIGCGPAGETAAVTAGLAGYRTLVVEAAGRPGGAMVNTGTIASKVLRETALVCSAFRRRPVPGIEARPDTDLSISAFMARTTLVQMEEHDRIEEEMLSLIHI